MQQHPSFDNASHANVSGSSQEIVDQRSSGTQNILLSTSNTNTSLVSQKLVDDNRNPPNIICSDADMDSIYAIRRPGSPVEVSAGSYNFPNGSNRNKVDDAHIRQCSIEATSLAANYVSSPTVAKSLIPSGGLHQGAPSLPSVPLAASAVASQINSGEQLANREANLGGGNTDPIPKISNGTDKNLHVSKSLQNV